MNSNQHPRTALNWAPEGTRGLVRPRKTLHRTTDRERKGSLWFILWSGAVVVGCDCVAW